MYGGRFRLICDQSAVEGLLATHWVQRILINCLASQSAFHKRGAALIAERSAADDQYEVELIRVMHFSAMQRAQFGVPAPTRITATTQMLMSRFLGFSRKFQWRAAVQETLHTENPVRHFTHLKIISSALLFHCELEIKLLIGVVSY